MAASTNALLLRGTFERSRLSSGIILTHGAGQSVTYRKWEIWHLNVAFTHFGGVRGKNKIRQATVIRS